MRLIFLCGLIPNEDQALRDRNNRVTNILCFVVDDLRVVVTKSLLRIGIVFAHVVSELNDAENDAHTDEQHDDSRDNPLCNPPEDVDGIGERTEEHNDHDTGDEDRHRAVENYAPG